MKIAKLLPAKQEAKTLKKAMKSAKENRQKVKGRAIASKTVPTQALAATFMQSMLGPVLPFMQGSMVGQRFMAGQTKWQSAGQKAYAKMMEQEKLRALSDRLRSSGIRATVGETQ